MSYSSIRQMPQLQPKPLAITPIAATWDMEHDARKHSPQFHKFNYEGTSGEFHCMKCVRICNYLTGAYCCDEARNKNEQKKKCDSYFLQMCFVQTAVKKMLDAMCEGKFIIKEDGTCFFCRSEKQHMDKYCEKKTLAQLYQITYVKEQRKMEKYLDKYLDLRKALSIKEHKEKLDNDTEKFEAMVDAFPNDSSAKLQLIRHRRRVRETIRKQEEFMDNENAEIEARFMTSFRKRKQDGACRLNELGKPDYRFNRIVFQMNNLEL